MDSSPNLTENISEKSEGFANSLGNYIYWTCRNHDGHPLDGLWIINMCACSIYFTRDFDDIFRFAAAFGYQ
jgi:hypothetical protein